MNNEVYKLKATFKFPDIAKIDLQEKEVTPTTESQNITADETYDGLSKVVVNAVDSTIDSNIKAENIKNGTTILGVAGEVIELNGQTTNVIPSKDIQTITPDSEHNALTSVVVEAISDEYVKPTGELSVTENGTYDVKNYASTNVSVPGVDDYFDKTRAMASFQYGQWTRLVKKLPTLTFTGTNANYLFANFIGESLPIFTLTDKITSSSYMFAYCNNTAEFPYIDVSESTDTSYMYTYAGKNVTGITLPSIDTSKSTTLRNMFQGSYFETIPEINADACTTIYMSIYSMTRLTNFGGFKNIGKSYSTAAAANNSMLTVDASGCTKLTEASLINILNGLYDIATKGCNTQKCTLGSTNLAKLTSTAGQTALANAQTKGWTIS